MNGKGVKAMVQRHDIPESPAANIEAKSGRAARPRGEYRLADMLDRMTAENLHPEVDFGKPEGEEQW